MCGSVTGKDLGHKEYFIASSGDCISNNSLSGPFAVKLGSIDMIHAEIQTTP
jgi:hypothetical protein